MDDTEYNHLYENFRYQTIPANDGTCKISWFNADNTPIAWSACTKEDDGVYRRMRVANITQYPSSGNVCPLSSKNKFAQKQIAKSKKFLTLKLNVTLTLTNPTQTKNTKKQNFMKLK